MNWRQVIKTKCDQVLLLQQARMKQRKRMIKNGDLEIIVRLSSAHPSQCLVRLLSSYHFFVRLALSCARAKTWLAIRERAGDDMTLDYLLSRSVTSNPSRNNCALLPDEPPAPAWPSAAKCWAWSTISRRRFRKACQIILACYCTTRPCGGWLPLSTSPKSHSLALLSH